MKIPRPGQLLLITRKQGTKNKRTYSKELVYVLQVGKSFTLDLYYNLAKVVIVALPKDSHIMIPALNMPIDRTHVINVKEEKANGNKIKLVTKSFLPQCISWYNGKTYEKLLRGKSITNEDT